MQRIRADGQIDGYCPIAGREMRYKGRMKRSEEVILTNMCMVYHGTKVLVEEKIFRDNIEEYSKGIVFPGGHVERHEPIVDSVIREIYEETGLTIESPRLCGVKDWVEEDGSRYVVFLFKTDKFSGELKSSNEGKVFWVELGDLPGMSAIWHMDRMLRIFDKEEFAELFLDAEHGWRPILK